MSDVLAEHLVYLSDTTRLAQFKKAITQSVKPGDLVADIGCGFGVLGMWCLRAGAARVWGIDSTGALDIARQSLTRAGLADRFEFIRAQSFHVDLPQQVDVIVCDHTGHFGLDYKIVSTLNDARRRFLKPGGRIIPARLGLYVGAVQSPSGRRAAEAWATPPMPPEYHWLRGHGVNTRHLLDVTPSEFLSEPALLGTVDFAEENSDYFSFKTDLRVTRDGVVDGLAGWHDTELTEGVFMTNSPLAQARMARASAFFPLDQPLAVKAGDRLSAAVMTRPGEALISWTVEAPASGRRQAQSTWKSLILGEAQFARAQSGWKPRLSETGEARKIVLGYCDGARSSHEIEQAVIANHPNLLPTRDAICVFVAQVLASEAR